MTRAVISGQFSNCGENIPRTALLLDFVFHFCFCYLEFLLRDCCRIGLCLFLNGYEVHDAAQLCRVINSRPRPALTLVAGRDSAAHKCDLIECMQAYSSTLLSPPLHFRRVEMFLLTYHSLDRTLFSQTTTGAVMLNKSCINYPLSLIHI